MATALYDDTILDFDLDFLHPTSSNVSVCKSDKRKAVMLVKKKIVNTDSLIKRYNAKTEIIEETEKLLVASKEECKQICIEYKNVLEKCSRLEKDGQALQSFNHELEGKYISSQTDCEALQSHNKQLQIRLKECEQQLKSYNNDKHNTKINGKKNDNTRDKKEDTCLKKDLLLLIDACFKKKPLKYTDKEKLMSRYGIKCDDVVSEDEMELTFSGSEDKMENDIIISVLKEPKLDGKSSNLDDHDSYGGNDLSSPSFVLSDFNNTDYPDTDSPSPDRLDMVFQRKNTAKTDVATSPLTILDTVHTATSPIVFEYSEKNSNITIPKITIDKASSPIKLTSHKDNSTSPNTKLRKCDASVPCITLNAERRENNHQIKQCLDLNNSNHISDDCSNDGEIASIVSRMQMRFQLLSPIPRLREKTPCVEPATVATTPSKCPELEKIHQENKILQASVSFLNKEVMSIKSLLKSQIFNSNSHLMHNNFEITESELMSPRNESPELTIGVNMDRKQLTPSPIYEDDLSRDIISIDPQDTVDTHTENQIGVSHIIFEDNESITNNIEEVPQELHETHESFTNGSEKDTAKRRTGRKLKKLTKLERLKKNILPKSKIKSATTQTARKLRQRTTTLLPTKKIVKSTDTSASLNEKAVYDNAVKVMNELNSKKEKIVNNEPKGFLKPSSTVNKIKEIVNTNKNTSEDTNDVHKSNKELDNSGDLQTRQLMKSPSVTTRSRSRLVSEDSQIAECNVSENVNRVVECTDLKKHQGTPTQDTRRGRKRVSLEKIEVVNKRMLRSSTRSVCSNSEDNVTLKDSIGSELQLQTEILNVNNEKLGDHNIVVDYNDLNIFNEEPAPVKQSPKQQTNQNNSPPKNVNKHLDKLQNSLLCKMIEKYSIVNMKPFTKKVSDAIANSISEKIESSMTEINEKPHDEIKQAMNLFVEDLKKYNLRHFIAGLMKYLKDPTRKTEMFNLISAAPAPPMTKSEQILLYVLSQLKSNWECELIEYVLSNIEHTLFQLNRTPEFGTIESIAHFYAVLCRYVKAKSRLRLFVLDAMYCIQFKAVPLIRQCLAVWMHILPLAHMGIAQSPLVTCLVYLLHFFKCEDRYNRVQELRQILSKKYFYKITDWNETKLLELFKNSIMELKGISVEKKMLRMALIILAKRMGPMWCQKHIIKNLLLPLIESEEVSERVKVFCLSTIGSLLKPYPLDMKVHCEIVMNELVDKLENSSSQEIQEAILTSLIFMSKHNHNRVVLALLYWNPRESVSAELEALMRDYVREKPLKVWKTVLSKLQLLQPQ